MTAAVTKGQSIENRWGWRSDAHCRMMGIQPVCITSRTDRDPAAGPLPYATAPTSPVSRPGECRPSRPHQTLRCARPDVRPHGSLLPPVSTRRPEHGIQARPHALVTGGADHQ